MTTDTSGRPWLVLERETTQHGIEILRGYPEEEPQGGPPRIIPTEPLIELLWQLKSEDALRTLLIIRGALGRLRQAHGITAQTQQRHLAAQERERQAHRLPDALPLAVLASPEASRHDPSPGYAHLLIDELQGRLHGRTDIARLAGVDYLRVTAWSEGETGMTYPEQYVIERTIARGRLVDLTELQDSPTPERIRDSRETAGIAMARAAALVRSQTEVWRRWETGDRPMPLARWELWCYKLRDLLL